MHPADLVTDLLDLVLARACLACDEPGRVLCPTCLEARRGRATTRLLSSGVPVTAALDYGREGGELLVRYKEHGLRALAPMLGVLLADAVERSVEGRAAVVVPVPSHRRPKRGFDALGSILRETRVDLGRRGFALALARPVVGGSGYAPVKSLGREERHRAVAGAFAVDLHAAHRVRALGRPVLVVDDVVTTGATAERVCALLRWSGIAVSGVAAVAAVSPDRPALPRAPARPTPRP